MSDQTEHLQSRPKHHDAVWAMMIFGATLGLQDTVLGWLGIDPAWPWFPYWRVGWGLFLAAAIYALFAQPPFHGSYAPVGWRRFSVALLASVTAFTAVLVLSAVA